MSPDPLARAREGDRARAVTVVETAFAAGRLSAPDRALRVERIATSATIGDLEGYLRDLGGLPPAPIADRTSVTGRAVTTHRSGVSLAVALVVLLVVVAAVALAVGSLAGSGSGRPRTAGMLTRPDTRYVVVARGTGPGAEHGRPVMTAYAAGRAGTGYLVARFDGRVLRRVPPQS